jgi:hypothetical protein
MPLVEASSRGDRLPRAYPVSAGAAQKRRRRIEEASSGGRKPRAAKWGAGSLRVISDR